MAKGFGLRRRHVLILEEAVGGHQSCDGGVKIGLTLHHDEWDHGGKFHKLK